MLWLASVVVVVMVAVSVVPVVVAVLATTSAAAAIVVVVAAAEAAVLEAETVVWQSLDVAPLAWLPTRVFLRSSSSIVTLSQRLRSTGGGALAAAATVQGAACW